VRTQQHTARSGARDVAVIALGSNGPFTVLSGSMKQHFGGRRFYNIEEVEMAVRELLRVQEFGCKHDGSFKLVPKMDVIVIGYFF
jgi:hypothetical protein